MKKQSPSLVKLTNLLADQAYHDGTSIGRSLRMTRSAVWKAITKLKKCGVAIDSIKGKGYAITEPLVMLSEAAIKKALTAMHCQSVFAPAVFESIRSTNDYLMALTPKKTGMICLAESQSHGKGRLGRAWHSPFGKNIYFSYLHRFEKDISELAGLSLVVGLAVAKTLNEYIGSGERCVVKWPNDVFCQEKKIAGNLIEMQAEAHGVCNVVIGIGINVNMQEDDCKITQPWTSLRCVTGDYIDRNHLSARLMMNLADCLDVFAHKGLSAFMDEWQTVDSLRDKTITLHRVNETVSGKVLGVNEQGHLLLSLQDGTVRAFSSGDATMGAVV